MLLFSKKSSKTNNEEYLSNVIPILSEAIINSAAQNNEYIIISPEGNIISENGEVLSTIKLIDNYINILFDALKDDLSFNYDDKSKNIIIRWE